MIKWKQITLSGINLPMKRVFHGGNSMESLSKEIKQIILEAKHEWEIKTYKELKLTGDKFDYIANYLVEHGVVISQ